MDRLMPLATIIAATIFFSVAYAAPEPLDLSAAAPLERLLTPEELEMEFGPASQFDLDGFVNPWHPEDDMVSKVTLSRYNRTLDLSLMTNSPIDRVERLVPDHLNEFYDLILYVSKATDGPFAQQMFIFERTEDGTLDLTDRWLVSTGRERRERYFTTTPPGLFMLDPRRMVRSAYSAQWDGSAMPWAMFWNYAYTNRMSGYAIHGIAPRYQRYLGRRASGGCVRLPIEHASALFNRVQRHYHGEVPIFTFNDETGTTSRDGTVQRDADGNIMTEMGYRVLLIVDTFAG